MSRRGLNLLLVVVGLLVVPVLLLGWLRLRTEDRLAELDPPAQPIVVAAREVSVDGNQAVLVSLTWGERIVAVSPGWSGTITGVHVAAGDTVSSGDRLVTVDGVTRVAATTDFPFWRQLRLEDFGDDVTQLQRLLTGTGHYSGSVDGTFGSLLVGAVNDFGRGIGVPDPGGVFDPAWVVWLPFETLEIANLGATLGGPAPSPGSPLLEGPSAITDVQILSGEGRPLTLDGEWIIQLGATELTVVDGVLTDDSITDLIELAADLGETEMFGAVRMAVPQIVLEVPATAVVSNASGGLCVWAPDGSGYAARSVTLGGGRVARVFIESGLVDGDQVLANPNEILDNPTCP